MMRILGRVGRRLAPFQRTVCQIGNMHVLARVSTRIVLEARLERI